MVDNNFFSLSRDNGALLAELNLTFPPGRAENEDGGHRFDWQRGEFCAILLQKQHALRLIFGRDVFGRKSLCWRLTNDSAKKPNNFCRQNCTESGSANAGGTFQLSLLPGRLSALEENDADRGWHEVPPGNIICLTLSPFCVAKFIPNANDMPSSSVPPLFDFHCELPSMKEFLAQTLCVHTYYPRDSVDQNSSLFEAFNCTKFTTAQGAEQILLGIPEIGTNAPDELLLDTAQINATTEEFVSRFGSALEGILFSVPSFISHHRNCRNDDDITFKVPVLFSGGVDSLMVALMAAEVLFGQEQEAISGQSATADQCQQSWTIRLFSVAFGNTEKGNFNEASDRAQSIDAYEYLKSRSMQKYGFNGFSLVLVNVDREELIECRRRHISEAIAPSKTVLDDSIGCVLWFASRMKGVDFDTGQEMSVNLRTFSPVFVAENAYFCSTFSFDESTTFALVGSGSDEQLGGYARHQTVFKNKGLNGLNEELSMEMHRIGARNFGRDDRIGTANGKSVLAPFLEEPLVCWLNTLPTALKTGFGLPQGAPNKFLLRNALRHLEVPEHFVQRPKRAMQFGTRMVKMETSENGGDAKLKGHQICEKLFVLQ